MQRIGSPYAFQTAVQFERVHVFESFRVCSQLWCGFLLLHSLNFPDAMMLFLVNGRRTGGICLCLVVSTMKPFAIGRQSNYRAGWNKSEGVAAGIHVCRESLASSQAPNPYSQHPESNANLTSLKTEALCTPPPHPIERVRLVICNPHRPNPNR